MQLFRQTIAGLRAMLVLTVILGVVYPLAVTAIAQITMGRKANGSMIAVGDKAASTLIAQRFDGPQWLHPRPSNAGDDGYDALASGASNLGPNSTELRDEIARRRAAIATGDTTDGTIPAEAVTASSSGLDPHISPEYAAVQVARIARARGVSEERVREAVAKGTEGRMFGFLGEPRVNVVVVNADLAR